MEAVFARDPAAVAVIESALIFEVERDARARGESETVLADWRRRIDRILVVTAPDELKIARYAARISPTGPGRAPRSRSRCPPPPRPPDSRRRKSRPVPTMSSTTLAISRPPRPGRRPLAATQRREQQFSPKFVSKIEEDSFSRPLIS